MQLSGGSGTPSTVRRSMVEHRYALWGFDDQNRPVAREDLKIQDVKELREAKGLRTYHINPMQGDPPPKPPSNRSYVRRNGKYEQVTLGTWVAETYHFSDIDTHL
jgi:hypothetical protein